MSARVLVATLFAVLLSVPCFAKRPIPVDDGQPGAIVLCYHIVQAPQDARMEVSRETFRQHLRYLEMTGYNVIPLQHLYEFVHGTRPTLPKNAVVITIDDGWRSAYTEAWPELREKGFPFTLFVYPKIIGQTAISLTWDQIKEMSEAGVDIQSHTLSHPYLSRGRNLSVEDGAYAKWLRTELVESKRILEKRTGHDVKYLAYPYGDYDSRVAASARRAGYDAALTCEFGKVKKGSDPLRMKRFVIDKRMDFAEFRRYLGATPMELAETTPSPGQIVDAAQRVITARLPNFKSVDPTSVGMALLSLGSPVPYSYDARTGDIKLVVSDALTNLKGKYHRAVVWATDTKTGRRVEASWTFQLPDPEPPPVPASDTVTTKPAPVIPVAASMIAIPGGNRSSTVKETRETLHRTPRK